MQLFNLLSVLLCVAFATMVNVRTKQDIKDTFIVDKTEFKLSKKDGKLMASIKLDSNAAVIGISADFEKKKLEFKAYDKDEEAVEWKHQFVAIAVAGGIGRTLMIAGLSPLRGEAQRRFAKDAKPDFMEKVIGHLDKHKALKAAVSKLEIASINADGGDKKEENKENANPSQ